MWGGGRSMGTVRIKIYDQKEKKKAEERKERTQRHTPGTCTGSKEPLKGLCPQDGPAGRL